MAKNNIPNSWELKRFTDFCDLKHGFQFREEHFVEKGIPVIKIGNIIDGGGIREDNLTYVKPELVSQYDNFKLNEGDILMALTGGTLGKVCLFPKKENIYLQNYRVGKFIPLKNANREYILQLLQSYIIQERISNLVNEAAQPNFGKQDFDKIIVSLPPLPEQKAIAHILGLMDEAINKNKQLIAQKEQRKKWLMQNLLTGKKRLKGFDGEWKKIRLGDDCELITKGTTPTSLGQEFQMEGIKFIKIESLEENGTIIPNKVAYINEETHNLLNRSQLKENDILISIAGALGRVAIVGSEILPANINQALAIVRLKKKNILQHTFLFHFLNSLRIKKEIEVINVQAAQANLSLANINDFTIHYPSIEEQTAIAQILQAADKEIQLLKAKTDKLKEQKKGMMQQLLTGKKRLKI